MARNYTYTYDDFLREMEKSGLGGQFSQADLNLARQNPDAGMSLLSYKTDYANATTDEARALANQGAESVRSSYGGYTGGGDGGSFKLGPMSPNQFTYGDAPAYEDRYADRIDAAVSAQQNRDPYSYSAQAPTYESRYDPQIQSTIAGILDRGEFSYDPKTDPVYSAYQKQYAREGQRATANALGEASAATGGMPSSWAVTAASQAGDYYASQMADKIPELYQDAYNRYLQEYQMKLSDLSALRGLESDDYQKYQDQLSQYNTDRSFDYGAWLDQQKLGQQDIENLRNLRSDDLDLYKTQLGQYNTDRSFDYGQWLDEIANQQTNDQNEWTRAETAAKYGDYSRLNEKGVDTSSAEYADAVSRAAQRAEVGDYSGFEALGFDTSNARVKQGLEIAAERAKVGDYSGYAALGIDTSNAELVDALERQYRQAQIANVYSNMDTEEDRNLDRQLKQAQLLKYLEGGSSTTAETENQRKSNLLTAAKMALSAGDYETYAALMKEAGYTADASAVQDKADVEAAQKAAKSGKISTMADFNAKLDVIREYFDQGDSDLDSREKVKAVIEAIPGYKKTVFGEAMEAFLDELFPAKTAKSVVSGPHKKESPILVMNN